MDPNEVRLRQARAQHAPESSAHSANSPNMIATVNPPHGGDMDPNEVRLRQARMQQPSGSSSPAAISPELNSNLAFHGGFQVQQAQVQPAQYDSRSHLNGVPSPPPSGYNTYQTPQSPQSTHSGGYFPGPNGRQPSYPNQAQQPQSPNSGFSTQVGYCRLHYES